MSATFDGFSIRDYTCKMRSIDVFKCWPFTFATSAEVTREDLQSWLPPMTLPTQSLRSNPHHSQISHNQPSGDQLSTTHDDDHNDEEQEQEQETVKSDNSPPPPPAAANDDDKLEMVCPVCRQFNAATLTAVNAHIDGCLAQTMREERRHMRIMNFKSKSKPPKKRSIAEIFRVEQEQEEEQEKDKDNDDEDEPRFESVLKLWPSFHDDDPDEVSITVTKFRWLSHRLEALRSNRGGGESAKSDAGGEQEEEKLEMVCPVCRDFNAATVTAVNAHIDGCLAQAVRDERRQMRRTTKPKAPKKRSIAEILTVAPPIGATKSKLIQVEEEDNGDSSETAAADAVVSTIKSNKSMNKINNNNKKKKKKKKTKKKGKKKKSKVEKHGDSGLSLNNEKKNKNKKKKKKNFNFFNNELPLKNKEDAYKRKVQTPVNSSRKLKGTIGNKMVALDDIDPSIHKTKLGSKILSVEKKQKVENCDSVGKQQKEVSRVRGVLKNHLKPVSGKTSSGCNIQDGAEKSHCDDQVPTSDRHVRFTAKDDILGPKRRNSFDETMFNKSSGALVTSLVKEQSSGSDDETASLEASRNIEMRNEACPIVESKQFSYTLEHVTIQNSLKPCNNQGKSKHLEEKSESLTKLAFCDNNNLQLFDGGNMTTLNCSPYADISRHLSTVQEVQMSGINADGCESGSFSSIGKFIDHLEDPTFQVAAVNSNANTRTFLEPSSSYSASSYNKANETPEFPLETYGDNGSSSQALGDRQLSHLFSADMIDNSFSFTGWGKGSVRTDCLDPNFFGLPLNSQGELINFSSSGKVGMNQQETSSTLRGSLSGLPVNNILHQSSPKNLSINERHVVRKTFPKDGLNPLPHYPARLAVTELQCREREDIHGPNSDMCSSHYVRPLNSELNLMINSFIEQNQGDRVQNHKRNGMISLKESSDHISLSSSQPTVRLMGKDVPIGRSSKAMQQFVGDVWDDEESRRRHYSEYAALENSLLGRCSKQDWVSGSPLQIATDTVLQSAKIQSNQASQSTVLMNGPDSDFPQQFIDLQSNHVSQNGSLGVSRNASSYFHPITQEATSCAVFNGEPDEFPEHFIPGAKRLGLSSQSQVLPTRCNFSQPTCLSNGELNDRYKNPHVTKLASEFPFLQPAVVEQAKTSWFQSPYRSLPSWLSSSTDQRLPVTFSQQFSGVSSQSFPQKVWGNNFTTPSVNHSAEVLYPSNPLTSLGRTKTTPLCPASLVQPLHVPVTPSTVNSSCRKVADRVKLDDMTATKDRHPCTNTRKRPAANLDDSRKPIKLPNRGVQENSSRMTRLTGENSSAELQQNTRAAELDPQADSARSRCCQNEAKDLHPASYPAVDSFKLHGTVASGPVRLGPGAKHILRSS